MGCQTSELIPRPCSLNKRAPRACEACRTRKVRCDVTRTKSPCTNCKLDGKTCTVPVSKRRHLGDRILGSSFDGKNHDPSGPICDAIIDFGDLNPSLEPKSDGEADHVMGDVSPEVFNISGNAFTIPAEIEISEHLETENVVARSENFLASYPSPTQTILGDHQGQSFLPPYLSPLPQTMSAEDLEYLQSRGAFNLPNKDTRDLLLSAYTKWVHPFAPMLDLSRILTAVHSNGTNGTVSLLLFQSLIFAAAAFFNAADLGHGGPKATRMVFYERARILHDFDIESDRLVIAQSAILLSFWDGSLEKVRDSYYWIGMASLHATSIGLHFDTGVKSPDPRRQRSLKLTWWSLLIRDRLVAVAMRRPVQNKAFRFDVPMLHMDDFELESLLEVVQKTLQIKDIGLTQFELLASCCMALAQLSEYIDKILSVQYSAQNVSGAIGQRAAVVSLVPKSTGFRSSDIAICGQELQNWYGYLPTEIQQVQRENIRIQTNLEHEVIRVHKALLAGYYSMTLMTLYRPLIPPSSTGKTDAKLQSLSVKMVFQAAKSITDIFSDLYADKLIAFLPETAIAVLEPAVVTHLLYSMSDVAKLRETSFQKFYLCWRILLQFGESYYLADTTISMLNAAAQRLKAHPDLRRSKPADCSSLIDEVCSNDSQGPKPAIAVPFIGVVGDQKRGDVGTVSAIATPDTDRDLFRPQMGSINGGQSNHDLEANCAMDGSPFEQLVSWDAFEEGFQS
ncbi:uncharacterized protein Z518_03482 [Rhinocladiella mackenziei CBS 650.93]|uniref:Zn(2)-C6 fungal-type domain-containing protein n=1 Tax=Rhinocladiella mackenziei CBS 650.93 TaxID=1442369 RepID=A0A0D2JHJ6_9EURO|nr:uncharacterized protein Z518_03482 [Rhinocladiella mackenziei CBS 650.93]KIX08825.1 hypothetical protein Z518_03482 [Rhinocladiella mackenziei CBS 650.93]